jgi:hypothetical protein
MAKVNFFLMIALTAALGSVALWAASKTVQKWGTVIVRESGRANNHRTR